MASLLPVDEYDLQIDGDATNEPSPASSMPMDDGVSTVNKCYDEEKEKEKGRNYTESLYRDRNLPAVLHKSENFIVINKGYDIKVNSNDKSEVTVEYQLCKLFPDLVDRACFHSFRFVHRLDYATSGVLCLALNKNSAALMFEAFKQRKVDKYYLALVRGHVGFDRVLIDVPTGKDKSKDWRGLMCTADRPHCHKPRSTTTLALCLERGSYDGNPATKLLLRPFTGRTHQLRLHCKYIGHTIVGDYTYSDRVDTTPSRMMLHSSQLFANLTGETLDISSPDPFTSDLDPKWSSTEICHTMDSAMAVARKTSVGDVSLDIIRLESDIATAISTENNNLQSTTVNCDHEENKETMSNKTR